MMKKALLVVSFGTSYAETCEKNIVACEKQLSAAFPDRNLFRAFTSGMIIRKLQQRDNISINNPEQALRHLASLGYQDIAIQSLHVINGDEYEKIVEQVQTLRHLFQRVVIGTPLLSRFSDYEQLINALSSYTSSLSALERVVFMGHGAAHHAFSAYACLDHLMMFRGLPMRVGAVESYPEVDLLITQLSAQNIRHVHLIPLMLVAGDHAINDMASEQPDSWKTQFNNAGIKVTTWLHGMGENPAVRDMFVEHLAQALEKSEEEMQ